MATRPGFTFKVLKDIDSKAFDELKTRLGGDKRFVNVGVPEGSPNHVEKSAGGSYQLGGTPLAMIAATHEFGAVIERGNYRIVIPERSFLRAGIRKKRGDFVRLNRINLVKILNGRMTIEQALGQLGEMAKGAVQEEIRHGEHKGLAESTKRAKGSSQPLIDTGQMVQSITYKVDEGSQ